MALKNEWLEAMRPEFSKPYYKELYRFIREEYKTHTVYPPADKIFHAFDMTPLNKVRVVIIGQDPYHGKGQANGMCFSVNEGVDLPPSLQNIFREIKNEYGSYEPENGCLDRWAEQGVFLLNTVLTVREHEPNSHSAHGWEKFTDKVIEEIEKQDRYIVYMLWGRPAQAKAEMITNPKHLVLKSSHPSPLSAYRSIDGFFGNRHFIKCDEFFRKHGEEPIRW